MITTSNHQRSGLYVIRTQTILFVGRSFLTSETFPNLSTGGAPKTLTLSQALGHLLLATPTKACLSPSIRDSTFFSNPKGTLTPLASPKAHSSLRASLIFCLSFCSSSMLMVARRISSEGRSTSEKSSCLTARIE